MPGLLALIECRVIPLIFFSEGTGSDKFHRSGPGEYLPRCRLNPLLECIHSHPPPDNDPHIAGPGDRTSSTSEAAEILYGFAEPGLCHSCRAGKHPPESDQPNAVSPPADAPIPTTVRP